MKQADSTLKLVVEMQEPGTLLIKLSGSAIATLPEENFHVHTD